jgi:hypothetical protein
MLKGVAADVSQGEGAWVLRRTSTMHVNICVLVRECIGAIPTTFIVTRMPRSHCSLTLIRSDGIHPSSSKKWKQSY